MWEDYEDIDCYDDLEKWYYYPDHLNSKDCWCEPVLDYENPETGAQVWVHNDIQ